MLRMLAGFCPGGPRLACPGAGCGLLDPCRVLVVGDWRGRTGIDGGGNRFRWLAPVDLPTLAVFDPGTGLTGRSPGVRLLTDSKGDTLIRSDVASGEFPLA